MTYVEKDCTIEHEGKMFTAGGAIVTNDVLIAYPAAHDVLKDWHGNIIGAYNVLSSWPINSWMGNRIYSIEAFVNGVRYVGRGLGEGMILRAKRSPRQ
jgi:hypothetical protein